MLKANFKMANTSPLTLSYSLNRKEIKFTTIFSKSKNHIHTTMKTLKLTSLILICLLIFSSLNAQIIRRTTPKVTVLQPIKIKAAINMARSVDFVKLGSKPVILEGYFVHDPIPMLITDMKWYYANTIMPDSVYVPIKGELAEQLKQNPDKYFGALIRLDGTLSTEKRTLERGKTLDVPIIRLNKLPVIIKERELTIEPPKIYNICERYPEICELAPYLTPDYALLYSGGVNAYNAHSRYWNDLKFMYKTLKSKYGYTDDKIVVVYKDGIAEDAEMTVDYAASSTGLKNALDFLDTRVKGTSSLFFFITNHGGGYNSAEGRNCSGVYDSAPLDEVDTYKYDETVFYYSTTNYIITDDSLAVYLNRVVNSGSNRLIAVMEPCFSGGLIRDLRGTNRVLVSAANEFEFSWGGGPGNHDIFSYYFTCALNKADHLGNPVNADTNGDGKISILEAFLYAKSRDTSSEHPLLEDSGDGVGTGTPSSTGTDGSFAGNVFL